MRSKFWALALTLFFASTAWAQPRAEVVILPLEMPGYYDPMDSAALTKTLEGALHEMAPSAKLQVSRAADLTAYGYQAGGEQPPTPELADKVCRAYGANYVCWVSVRFQPDYKPESGALALGGAARLWAYSADGRKVVVDQPLSLVRVGQVKAGSSDQVAQAEARELAGGCIKDLAYQIVGIARSRNARPPAAMSSWPVAAADDPTQSKNYRNMLKATQAYQRAVRDNSLVDITTSQANLTRCWTVLNQAERTAISQNYPDLKEAMTAVPVYNYGGYGYPYGWGYGN